jgi:hypothetical protein
VKLSGLISGIVGSPTIGIALAAMPVLQNACF